MSQDHVPGFSVVTAVRGRVSAASGRLPATRVVVLVLVLVLALALVAVVGACRSDEPSRSPTAGTATPPPASAQSSPELDLVEAAKQAALEAYRGMWAAFSQASQNADPDHPDLAVYATGDALDVLVSGLEANRRDGLVSDGDEVVLYPEVMEVEPADAPTEVTISDCADTSNTRRIRPSGPPFTDAPGGWRQVTATVQLVDEAWKVSDFAVQEVGSCVPEE